MQVQLGLDYELRRNVIVSLAGGYENDTFFGQLRKDNVLTSDTRVKYLIEQLRGRFRLLPLHQARQRRPGLQLRQTPGRNECYSAILTCHTRSRRSRSAAPSALNIRPSTCAKWVAFCSALPAGGVAPCGAAGLALLYLLFAATLYTATSTVLVDPRRANVVGNQPVRAVEFRHRRCDHRKPDAADQSVAIWSAWSRS
jgi:hypothetical protein